MKIAASNQLDYLNCLIRSFASWYGSGCDVWSPEPEMRGLISLAEINARSASGPRRALDIGAGRGFDTQYLLNHQYEVVAIDLCRMPEWDQLESAHRLRVEFRQGNFLDLSMPSDFFSLIVDNGCFHHQHQDVLNTYLQKIYESLQIGGTLALSVFCSPDRISFQTIQLFDGRLVHIYDESTLKSALVGVGFSDCEFLRIERQKTSFKYDYLYAFARKKIY